ncbi:Methyltransferase-like protein 9 [Holothuria leucospilota]|uniref:Methyltransferase-like protein 9 n=1 Tax=Holothuria leucospilota TaxID=206669 RepID=A0A9Q1CBV9_HOLLE|nr:Methyltransferase-like protein 9 [Holothuria leucospilota]
MIRNPLLRVAYEHEVNTLFHRDQLALNFDISKWYDCNLEKCPPDVASKFLKFDLDGGTSEFLDKSYEKSNWLFTQVWHSVVRSLTAWFVSTTSINGWLGRGCMFVFSETQFLHLIEKPDTWKGDLLLDLGAGDGTITDVMAPFFTTVSATEVSRPMINRLSSKGYRVLNIDEWSHTGSTYDVISCLNLLDRCEKPNTILKDMRRCLKPSGLAIVALVLPYRPFVESRSAKLQPNETLPITGRTWEQQVTSFICTVAPESGFEVVRFSRLPYLCEGDLSVPFYYLTDAVFVLKPA